MAGDSDGGPETATLADVPGGLKRLLRWTWLLYTDRPAWQKPVLGFAVFVVLGVSAGIQYLITRELESIRGKIGNMGDGEVETDGGRNRRSQEATRESGGEPSSTGGLAFGGAIAGGTLGSVLGPGGALGGAVFGAIVGDEFEKYVFGR